MPVAVTDNADAARERAARLLHSYGLLPSYRRMLDMEGVQGPADVAVVGSEAEVERRLRSFADAGATDILATVFPVDASPTSVERTNSLLQSLVGKI